MKNPFLLAALIVGSCVCAPSASAEWSVSVEVYRQKGAAIAPAGKLQRVEFLRESASTLTKSLRDKFPGTESELLTYFVHRFDQYSRADGSDEKQGMQLEFSLVPKLTRPLGTAVFHVSSLNGQSFDPMELLLWPEGGESLFVVGDKSDPQVAYWFRLVMGEEKEVK